MADLIKTLTSKANPTTAFSGSPGLGFVEGFVPTTIAFETEKRKSESDRTTELLKEKESRSMIMGIKSSQVMTDFLRNVGLGSGGEFEPGRHDIKEVESLISVGKAAGTSQASKRAAEAKQRAAKIISDANLNLKNASNAKQALADLDKSIGEFRKAFSEYSGGWDTEAQATKTGVMLDFLLKKRAELWGYIEEKGKKASWDEIRSRLNLDMDVSRYLPAYSGSVHDIFNRPE